MERIGIDSIAYIFSYITDGRTRANLKLVCKLWKKIVDNKLAIGWIHELKRPHIRGIRALIVKYGAMLRPEVVECWLNRIKWPEYINDVIICSHIMTLSGRSYLIDYVNVFAFQRMRYSFLCFAKSGKE
jgi:hypothetical protein